MVYGYYSLQKPIVYVPYIPNNYTGNDNINNPTYIAPEKAITNANSDYIVDNSNVSQETNAGSSQSPQSPQSPQLLQPSNNTNVRIAMQENIINNPPPPPIITDVVKRYDYHKLYDPLQDPRQRPDRYLLGPIPFNPLFNVPTQGYADTYRWMGLLIHTNKDRNDSCGHGCGGRKIINNENHKGDFNHDSPDVNNRIIKFFGRQKNPGSNKYQYYATISSGNDMIKIFLNYHRELYDDDVIYISELNGHYRVQLNRNDDVSYNPYIGY